MIPSLVPVLGLLVWALCKFGLNTEISEADSLGVATGIAILMGIVGMFFTVATTDKLGILPGKPEKLGVGD